MDLHRPRTTVLERVRIERVSRRLDAARFGRNYHRNQQLHDISFIILLAIAMVGGILLLSM